MESETERLRSDLRTLARRYSHDLRTPLGSMHANAELLQASLRDSADAAVLQSILDAGEEIARLIGRISFVLQASAGPADPTGVPMGRVVAIVRSGLHERAAAAGADLVAPDRWPEALGVDSWLEVVWWNLLDNALRHGGPSPRIELGAEREGEHCNFWIRSPRPIAPERGPFLFFPFERLHEIGAPRGWGLPIVRRLVEPQGGRCGWDSGPLAGALFYFTLPAG